LRAVRNLHGSGSRRRLRPLTKEHPGLHKVARPPVVTATVWTGATRAKGPGCRRVMDWEKGKAMCVSLSDEPIFLGEPWPVADRSVSKTHPELSGSRRLAVRRIRTDTIPGNPGKSRDRPFRGPNREQRRGNRDWSTRSIPRQRTRYWVADLEVTVMMT